MQLSDAKGTSLSLTVSGYEFPSMASELYDSNWLNIAGKVGHPRGGWTFHDACLLTYELEGLCDWLDAVAADPSAEHDPECFIEPNLEFSVVHDDNRTVLRVHLSHESSPPWLADPDDRFDGVDLDFPLKGNDLGTAARGLRELLSRFPQRAER